MEDLTGKQFGHYQIVAPLGEGGMAAVYKAYQPNMERYVAIKVLPRHMAASDEFTARFRREARLLAQLQHPHILPVFDFGEAEGYPYIVMPYIVSGTLADSMHSKRLSLSEVRRILTQLGDALSYAHTRGLIHRDIKPSNVLVDEGGNCLLTDFGLARMAEASTNITTSGAIMGTPAYMSPEQGAGSTIDHRSDIYSLGIVLYEMVTGRVPYIAETPVAVVFKHIQDPLPSIHQFNPDLPDSVELVLRKALAKNPDDRYQHAEDFVSAIQNAISDPARKSTVHPEISTIPIEPIPAKAPRPSRKWILPVGILVSILALGAIWINTRSNSQGPSIQPSSTALQSPTSIPAATMTQAIETTPLPSATIVAPTSDKTFPYLNDIQLLEIDSFDEPLASGWTVDVGIIENGLMEIIGNENWYGASYNSGIGEFQAAVIDFIYPTDTSLFEMYLENGAWNTAQYKRVGLYVGSNQADTNIYIGTSDHGGTKLSGNLTLKPETTYSLFIAVLPNNEFLEVIWDPADPSETLSHREKIDENWDGITWTLWIGGYQTTIQFDNFQKIAFSSVK